MASSKRFPTTIIIEDLIFSNVSNDPDDEAFWLLVDESAIMQLARSGGKPDPRSKQPPHKLDYVFRASHLRLQGSQRYVRDAACKSPPSSMTLDARTR